MKKLFFLAMFAQYHLALPFPNPPLVPPLKILVTHYIVSLTNDPIKKEVLLEALKNSDVNIIEKLEFKDRMIGELDFSEFNLSNQNFTNHTFNKTNLNKTNFKNVNLKGTRLNYVNLKGADLRGTFSNPENFEGCVFNFVNLEGALLYGETEEEFLYLKGRSVPYNLVRQYSDLIKKIRVKKENGLTKEVEILHKQTNVLKNFGFGSFR